MYVYVYVCVYIYIYMCLFICVSIDKYVYVCVNCVCVWGPEWGKRGQRRSAESPKRALKKQKFVQCNACLQGPRVGTRNLAASVSSAMFWDQNRFRFTTSMFSKGTGQYVKLRVCWGISKTIQKPPLIDLKGPD